MSRNAWIILGILAALALVGGGGVAVEVAVVSDLDARVKRFADGIEIAEGYNVAGSLPNRLNNPGDLKDDITGTAIGTDAASGLMIYGSYADGRAALEHQVRLALTNQSHIYNAAMTLEEFAIHYVGTNLQEAADWANNVAAAIGASIDTPIGQV